MKVEFKYIGGRTRVMDEKFAVVLEKLRKGTYTTRELRAAENIQPPPAPVTTDDERDLLRAELDKRGIPYHHRAGVETLRKLLEG